MDTGKFETGTFDPTHLDETIVHKKACQRVNSADYQLW